MREVVILGAGLAGLSTGIQLLERGGGLFKVRLLERGHVFGGKASSMVHKRDDKPWTVDHGFHVFFDYPNLRARLEALGGMSRLTEAKHEVLIWSDSGVRRFRARPWPSPLHLLTGGVDAGLYDWTEGLKILAFMTDLLTIDLPRLTPEERRAYDEKPFDELAREAGLGPDVVDSPFFRFVAQSAFVYPHPMSSLSAIAAIQLVSQDYDAVACRYLEEGLGDVVIAPLVAHFKALGGVIQPFQKGVKLRVTDGRVSAVTVRNNVAPAHGALAGTTFSNYHSPEPVPGAIVETDQTADWYVSALAPKDLLPLLEPASAGLDYFARIGKLQTQRTIALQIWFDRLVSPPDADGAVVGLPGPFSTVIDLARVQKAVKSRGSLVQFVGEEGAFAGAADADIVKEAKAVLARLWPASAAADIDREFFHRGHHDDFFLTTPGTEANRPQPRSPHPNLVLAGDYVLNGVDVVCMEGAYVSGLRAANEILREEGCAPAPILPLRRPDLSLEALRRLRRLAGA